MKVAVIGAGISGLTFTAAMKRQAPEAEVTLFERDVSAGAGRMAMRSVSGTEPAWPRWQSWDSAMP